MASENKHNVTGQRMTPSLVRWSRRFLITLTVLGWLVMIAVLFWLIRQFSSAVILLLLGATIATVIYPVTIWLSRIMPRFLAITIVYVILVIGLGILLYFVVNVVIEQITSLSQYIQSLTNANGNNQLQPIIQTLQQFGITQTQLHSFEQQAASQLQGAVNRVVPFISNLFNVLVNFILVVLLSIYFLLSGPRVVAWLRHKTPLQAQESINFLLDTLGRVIGGNFRGVLIDATIISVLTGVGLYFLGVPYAFLLAVLAFVLEFIPIIGFYITAIAMVLVALTQGWLIALLTLGLALLLQALEGEILAPRVIGSAVGVNPIIQIAAIIGASQVFGILGAFFAGPAAGLLQSVVVALWHYWKKRYPAAFPQNDN